MHWELAVYIHVKNLVKCAIMESGIGLNIFHKKLSQHLDFHLSTSMVMFSEDMKLMLWRKWTIIYFQLQFSISC
jgi:hypothetical protein